MIRKSRSSPSLSALKITRPAFYSFLDAYPHPAFTLDMSARFGGERLSKAVRCPSPTYTNTAFAQLFCTTTSDIETCEFVNTIRQPSSGFAQWMAGGEEPTFSLEVNLEFGVIPIDITKTRMDLGVWVCTTVPRLSKVIQIMRKKIEERNTKDVPFCVKTVIENFDWASCPLGPKETWSQILLTAFDTVVNSSHAAILYWGQDPIGFYNDAYAKTTGADKYPQTWGQPGKIAWGEAWDVYQPCMATVLSGGQVQDQKNIMFVNRLTAACLPEECYIRWNYVPIHIEDGTVGGFVNNVIETTGKIIAKRRAEFLRGITTATLRADSLIKFGELLILALSNETYSKDVSFAALYFCQGHSNGVANGSVPITLNYGGSIGIPTQHPSTPNSISFSVQLSNLTLGSPTSNMSDGVASPWPFEQVISTRQVVHIEHLDPSLVANFERRGWEDEPREAVVIPIGPENQTLPVVVLILGINTRRPYDAVYQGDIDTMRMALSSTLQATLSREAEVKRSQQLAELDAAKTTFFSNASHELRTPLTLIREPLENCIDHVPQGHVRQQLQVALRNTNRLKRLVDSLMDFSKVAANKLEGQFRPVNLGLLTANLASLFRNSVEMGGLKYNISCDTTDTQPVCYVDSDIWEQIVCNLVGNAVKYTLTGSITVSIVYTATSAVFTVEDTGCGIPKDDVDKIFDRFHRVYATSRRYEGTGIGLALTKDLVALHGGEISAKSNNTSSGSHGTKITVIIPLGRSHLPKANVCEESLDSTRYGTYARNVVEDDAMWIGESTSPGGQLGETISEEPVLPNQGLAQLDPSTMFFHKTDVILLVDDNPDMRWYLKSILSRYCTVVEASNGKEALENALAIKPNIVLTDMMMPVLGGPELLKELRARKETQLIPVIFVTAKSGDDSRIKGLLSGADDYLPKPFKSAELIARVHLQMQLGKRRAEMEENERTEELQQLSELSPVAIFRANIEGSISYVNPRWYDITGHSHDNLDMWPENLHSDYKRWNNGNWCQGQCVSMGHRGVLGAFTDTSKQKNLELAELAHALEKETAARQRAEEAEERRKEAEDRRRDQELLIDVTSHELRQPVSAILNCSSLVRTNLSTLYDNLHSSNGTFRVPPSSLKTIREDLDALDAIYQCGLAQERIANDVLSLSRMQLDVLNIIPVKFDLRKEIGRIASLFRNETQMKNIKLSTGFGPLIEQLGVREICSDKGRFTQVITNLLSNAIKFTEISSAKRNIHIEVDIRLEPPNADSCEPSVMHFAASDFKVAPNTPIFIYVSVTDSGPGLAPDDLTLLFQRFQQGSNSHDVFGGSGLGLFVSKKLCSLMGGRIEVVSTQGHGATFRFFIQAMTAATQPPASVLYKPHAQMSSLSVLRPMHILIAEDNLINQTVLHRQLTQAGCTTVLVSNGQQAIDALRTMTKPFDAVLMDIEMPVLDGLSAVWEIRRLEVIGELLGHQHVFALTANAREGQVKSIRQAGMDDVLIKPYRINELLNKLSSLHTL